MEFLAGILIIASVVLPIVVVGAVVWVLGMIVYSSIVDREKTAPVQEIAPEPVHTVSPRVATNTSAPAA